MDGISLAGMEVAVSGPAECALSSTPAGGVCVCKRPSRGPHGARCDHNRPVPAMPLIARHLSSTRNIESADSACWSRVAHGLTIAQRVLVACPFVPGTRPAVGCEGYVPDAPRA